MSALRFEPVSDVDLEFLRALVSDSDVVRFTRVPDPPPADFAEQWLDVYRDDRVRGLREAFVILDDVGARVGVAIAPRIDRESATVELGYVVAPAARGRGVATSALEHLTRWAIEELSAERLELLISVHNEGSQRVARRCGYRLEGVLRGMYVKPGLREDTQLWSRLRDDPA